MSDANDKVFTTGAVRSGDRNNVRYDLISPIGLKRVAETYAEGAEKRGAHNWENGMPVADLLNHALAHLFDYLAGDRSQDHLAHAGWNVLAAIHSETLWPELNENQLRGPGCQVPVAAQVLVRPESPADAFAGYEDRFRFVDMADPDRARQALRSVEAEARAPGRG